MAEQEDRLSLDASDYKKEIKSSAAELKEFNKTVEELTDELNKNAKAFNNIVVTFKDVSKSGQDLSATITKVEGAFKRSRAAAISVEGINTRLIKQEKEYIRTLNLGLQLRKQLDAFKASKEKEAENKFLKESKEHYASILADEKRLAQHEKERKTALEGQARVTRALAEARTKALSQTREQARVEARARDAQRVGASLQGKFVDPFKGVATPAQTAAITAQIGKIVAAIQSGAIKARQAQQIISNTLTGTPQILTGTAAQIQGITTAMQNASNRIGSSGRNISNSFTAMGNAGDDASKRIIIGWGSALRIFQVQLFHTAVGAFISQLREATDTARTFLIRIGEIQTISQGSSLTFKDWATSIRQLSDEFGNPILDVAEGVYEGISNQVAKGAEAAAFFREALEFARVTVSSTEDSVNLLSSVINAYRLNTSDANKISGIFFKTIDLGRVRAGDLANTLGRIAPLGANLGIRVEELAAAIATLTIQGITPAETLTALNGVMTKLLRPTEAMKKLLSEWGVASGEAAIATFGFEGVLQKIVLASQSGQAELAELFNEIRATRGITGLTRALDNYGSTLDTITNDSQASFNAAVEQMATNLGVNFTVELNKLKNYFVNDFGINFIKILLDFGTGFDAAGNQTRGFIDVVKTLLAFGRVAIGTFASVKIAILASTAAIKLQEFAIRRHTLATVPGIAAVNAYKNSLVQLTVAQRAASLANPLTAAITGIGIASLLIYEGIKAQNDNLRESYESLGDRITKAVEKTTERTSEQLQIQKKEFERFLTQRFAAYGAHLGQITTLSNRIAEEQAKTQEANAKAIDNSFDIFVKNAQDNLAQLNRFTDQALRNIEDAQARITRLQDNLSEGRFNAELKLLPGPEQIKALEAEIFRLQNLAAARLTAESPTAEIAEQQFKEAEKILERADKLQNELLERRAKSEQDINTLIEKRAELATRLEADKGIIEAAANLRDVNREQQTLNASRSKQNADDKQAALERRFAAQDELTTARSVEEIRRDQAALQDIDAQLAAQQAIIGELGAEADIRQTINGFQEQQVALLNQFIAKNAELKAQTEAQAEIERQRIEILKDIFTETAKFKLPEGINADNLQETLEGISSTFSEALDATNNEQIIKQLIEQRTLLEEQAIRQVEDARIQAFSDSLNQQREGLQKQQADASKATQDLATQQAAEVERVRGIIDTIRKGFTDTFGDAFTNRAQEVTRLLEAFELAFVNFEKNNTLQTRQAALQAYSDLTNKIAATRYGFSRAAPEDVIVSEATANEAAVTLATLNQQIATALHILEGVPREQQALQNQLAEAEAAINTLPTLNVHIDTAAGSMDNLRRATDELASKFRSFGPSGAVENKALGGWMRPRGTDIIPAMLSPGEFVVNAKSTQRYMKELLAINAGFKPVYRAQGGPIPQVSGMNNLSNLDLGSKSYSFGDVNVSYTSSGDAKVDARQVAGEINRMIRRGVVQLKG